MRRSSGNSWGRTWLGLAVVLVLSVLIGVWQARIEEHALAIVDHELHSLSTGEETERFDQIEQALAQAGCPGWMVLASEGPTALGPEVVPEELRQASAELPIVEYAQPLHVALNASAKRGVVSKAAPASDPDDLLDGMPDLLWGTGEPPITEDSAAGGGATDPDPGDDASAGSESENEPESSIEESEPQTLPPIDELPAAAPARDSSETGGSPSDALPPVEKEDEVTPTPEEGPHLPIELPTVEPETLPTPSGTSSSPPAEAGSPAESPFAPSQIPQSLSPHSMPQTPTANPAPDKQKTYCEFIAESLYPSAFECAKCHQKIFDEWSISSHAYAAVSPMFHKFEQKINDLSQGTIGYFC